MRLVDDHEIEMTDTEARFVAFGLVDQPIIVG